MTTSKFVGSGIMLFLDQVLVAGGNWFYWVIVSLVVSPSEIGHTTSVYNLIALISVLIQLGLEYPILKKSSIKDSQILGTALLLILATTLPVIPILVLLLNVVYEESFQIIIISISLLVAGSLSFVCRFILVGVSALKNVFLIDTISTAIKFVIGYVLTINGYGALGLLLSFSLQALFIAVICSVLSFRLFGFSVGKMKYIKKIVREAIVNVPSKLSSLLIFFLSTVLLAPFGITDSEIGIFYMALMISYFTSAFVLSMAQMAIPHSAASNIDLSSMSVRIGLSFTAPFIGALIVSPSFVLSLLGTQYLAAETTLLVLAIGIFPFSIVVNGLSKFNYSGELIKVLLIGSIQLSVFAAAFLFLISEYRILGVAFSVLIAYAVSSVLVIIWSERRLRIYIANFGISIFTGAVVGHLLGLLSHGGFSQVVSILSSICIIITINIVLKNTTPVEIKQLLKLVAGRRP